MLSSRKLNAHPSELPHEVVSAEPIKLAKTPGRLTLTKEVKKAEGMGPLKYLNPADCALWEEKLSAYEDNNQTPEEQADMIKENKMLREEINELGSKYAQHYGLLTSESVKQRPLMDKEKEAAEEFAKIKKFFEDRRDK